MVVCQFYLRDQCKFGSNCRNEHPVPKPAGFGGPSWGSASQAPQAPQGSNTTTGLFTPESIQRDFGPLDKPLWPLSSYGTAKHEPTFLTGLDISPEELRARAAEALRSEKGQEYMQFETTVIQNANNAYAKVMNDPKGAFEAAFQLSKGIQGVSNQSNTFGGGSGTTSSAFGTNPAFGQSAFGQNRPSGAATNSAFGQPAAPSSAFGSSAPAFGQSAFGAASKPAFGASSFGQPASTGFGASTNSTSAFGASTSGPAAPSAGAGAGGFAAFAAKPTSLAAPTFGQSGFGAVAAAATNSTPAFAQPVADSPFGTSNNPPQGSGFSAFSSGGPSAFGASSTGPPNPFGSAPANSNPLNPPGATSAFAPARNPLDSSGSTSVFGQPSAPPNPFGQSTNSLPGGFGSMGLGSSVSAPPNPFGPKPTGSAFGAPSLPANPFGSSAFSSQPPPQAGRLSVSRPVTDPYASQLPPNYMDMLPKEVQEAFASDRFTIGNGKDGEIGIPWWIPPLEMR